jgi:hypothetical protein
MKIVANFVTEILGKPREYVENVLKDFIERIGSEKDVNIRFKKIHEAIETEEKEIFSSFAEVEADFANLDALLKIIFTYMPSHIEIVEPTELKLCCNDLNNLMNQLIARLHQYDSVAKTINFHNRALLRQLEELKKQQEKAKPKDKKEKVKSKKGRKKN